MPEIMHDIKNLCDNLVRLLIGKTGSATDGYSGWSKDAKHRSDCKRLGVFPEVWDGGKLPWRLTAEERKMLDQRTSRIAWPHYVEPLYYRGASFWKKPNRMWKCRRKYRLLLFFLPVLLRDCVPKVREAVVLIASALRRLEGQSYSAAVAKSMGILPGSRAIKKSEIDAMHADLLRGLVLLEGCVPIGNLIPSTHHFVHYGGYTKTHGILRLFWMMAFERLVYVARLVCCSCHNPKMCAVVLRYNKYLKNLVRDMYQAEVNLSRNVVVDAACAFDRLDSYVTTDYGCHTCVLSGETRDRLTQKEFDHLMHVGCPINDIFDASVYCIAKIMGKHFRSGEWGCYPRCGSVFTMVLNGRSVYGRVNKFVRVAGDTCPGYACVSWFSEPTYSNCLCPKVGLNGEDIEREVNACVVKITQLDPAQVAVESVPDSNDYYMIRDSGYDTRR